MKIQLVVCPKPEQFALAGMTLLFIFSCVSTVATILTVVPGLASYNFVATNCTVKESRFNGEVICPVTNVMHRGCDREWLRNKLPWSWTKLYISSRARNAPLSKCNFQPITDRENGPHWLAEIDAKTNECPKYRFAGKRGIFAEERYSLKKHVLIHRTYLTAIAK